MSVNLTRTETISSPVINRETIANLIENAVISGVGVSDLAAGCMFITAQSDTPSATEGMWWWDMFEQLMKVWDSTHSVWLAIGPDRRDIAVRNWSGGVLPKGGAVSFIPGESNLRVQAHSNATNSGICPHMVGTMTDTTASGMWGGMSYQGIVWLLDDENGGSYPIAPNHYIRQSSIASKFNHPNQSADPMAGSMVLAIAQAGSGDCYLGNWIGYKRATP